jgi:hypothetical protein
MFGKKPSLVLILSSASANSNKLSVAISQSTQHSGVSSEMNLIHLVQLFCINNHLCYFGSCCQAVSQFLYPISSIFFWMPDKICSPHICISLNDVSQEELIAGFIVTNQQKEILSLISLCERILILILVPMSPLLYASISFNVKL